MMDNPLSAVLPDVAPRTSLRLGPGRRVYAVGDVHGHIGKLQEVHRWIAADLLAHPVAHPVLVHLGDLIDRGPDAAGCIGLLSAGPPIPGVPTHNLMGNHEWMMLVALDSGRHEDMDRWLDNGGAAALRSWGVKSTAGAAAWMEGIPARHLVFLRDLVPHYTLDDYLFVHAGVRPGVPMAAQRSTDLLWIRESFLKWDGIMLPEAPQRIIVHGHTPSPEPTLKHNRIGIDTGAGKGGPLTCAVLEGETVRLFQAT